ncbi:hypothetical protein CERSUDRAFT_111734 [Gelatoporia subvermispora B]|uniref:BTB domain-containing protein n=1 Tax=Ceriporiopsis subvermispora (strain B) TaxID=914234 RepID=M2RRX6_CERS8|nr:hypothetical protein CERSUDRAFT_111734 [Gelatoporia subvermispora B]
MSSGISDRNTSKRRREEYGADEDATESDIPSKPPTSDFESDSTLWFEDGNVIMVADSVGFRLYRGVLSARSTVFQNLFQIPQPTDGETYEGCPVIRLQDTAEDLRHLLRAFMGYTNFPDPARPTFKEVVALARLSHKYDVEDLQKASEAQLKSMFPTRYEDWESMKLSLSLEDAIQAINLAHLTNTPSILPLAMYRCCKFPLESIPHIPPDKANTAALSSSDRERCFKLQGWLKYQKYRSRLKLYNSNLPPTSCESDNHSPCTYVLQSILKKLIASSSDLPQPYALLETQTGHELPGMKHLCKACRSIMDQRERAEIRSLWRQIPLALDMNLPEWC